MQITYQDVLDRRAAAAEMATPEMQAKLAAHIAAHAPRFTCPRCGEHRDTTVRGHCDDCEA